MVLLVLIVRTLVFLNFDTIYTDSDQLVLWSATNDMLHGKFHEPCFYGQAYNPLWEPLLAQPLLWLGFSIQNSLSAVANFLGIFPYLLLISGFIRKKNYFSAISACIMLLLFPRAFHFVTSMPRGYLPACAIASIGVYMALFSTKQIRFYWFALASLIALATSENSLFLTFPVGVYLFVSNFKIKKFYWLNFLGLVTATPLPLYIWWFYKTHPAHNIHHLAYDFGFGIFLETLKMSNLVFKDFSTFGGNPLIYLTMFYLIFGVVSLLKKSFNQSIAIFLGLAFFYFSLSFDKSQNAMPMVFFSGARMFLGVPLSFLVFFYWAESSLGYNRLINLVKPYAICIFALVGVIVFGNAFRSVQSPFYYQASYFDIIQANRIKDVRKQCDQTEMLCKKYKSNLVIINDSRTGLNYMAAALNYPYKTLIPRSDRRTWEMEAEDTTIRENFILYTHEPYKMYGNFIHPVHFLAIPEDPFAFCIFTDHAKVFDILKIMNMDVRAH